MHFLSPQFTRNSINVTYCKMRDLQSVFHSMRCLNFFYGDMRKILHILELQKATFSIPHEWLEKLFLTWMILRWMWGNIIKTQFACAGGKWTHLKPLLHIKRRMCVIWRVFQTFYHSWFERLRAILALAASIVVVCWSDIWQRWTLDQFNLMISGLFVISNITAVSDNCVVIAIQVFIGVRRWHAISLSKRLRTPRWRIDCEWRGLVRDSRYSVQVIWVRQSEWRCSNYMKCSWRG